MHRLGRLRAGFERLLEIIVVLLMVGMVVIVVAAVGFRKAGRSLIWYDEVASIVLAWLTYYGAALAALKRRHVGVAGVVQAMPRTVRLGLVVASEVFVFSFFALLAWVGYEVLVVLEGDNLVSLPSVPTRLTQSVIPVGAVVFLMAEALSLPALWRETGGGARSGDVAAKESGA